MTAILPCVTSMVAHETYLKSHPPPDTHTHAHAYTDTNIFVPQATEVVGESLEMGLGMH